MSAFAVVAYTFDPSIPEAAWSIESSRTVKDIQRNHVSQSITKGFRLAQSKSMF